MKITGITTFVRIFAALNILLFYFLSASIGFAHGGMKQIGGDIIVTDFQTPLSPYVGEKVTSTYIFTNSANVRLVNKPVTLKLIDTYYGDQSKDKVILTKQMTTDVNGIIFYDYTFNKANYFDTELTFTDSHNVLQTIGFLIQTRDRTSPYLSWFIPIGVSVILGLSTACFVNRIYPKKILWIRNKRS